MSNSPLQRLLDEIVGPLVEQDAGELHVSTASETQLNLHLGGAFSGCPGNTLAIRRVIDPILRARLPMVRLSVTSGALIPPGAVRWNPSERATKS